MKIKMIKKIIVSIVLVFFVTLVGPTEHVTAEKASAIIVPYEQIDRYQPSTNYSLTVNGVEVPVIKGYDDYDYAHFSASEGPAVYDLTILNTDKVHEYDISPKKYEIKADELSGRTLTFTREKPEYLIITMNNRKTKIVIAADPIETDVPEKSGQGIFNVSEAPYNLVTDKIQATTGERTAIIQQAIDDASAFGTAQGDGQQGVVYLPKGEYDIGNLVLKSNSALYLEAGAALVGTGKTADYQEHWFKDSMGRPATWWLSTEFDSSNIKIYGRGTIDGNGRALHDDKSTNGKGMINNLVVPIATSGFKMDGVIIRESAAWAVMPVRSNDLAFTNIKMFNSLSMGENDGIDVVESQDVIVKNTIGIALDDPYSTKSWGAGTDIASGKVPWPGEPEPVNNVLFEDNISWTYCYGYKIGQGVIQTQENIVFNNNVVYKAAVGFAIHLKYGNATVRNVTFENMDVEDISGRNDDNSAWMTMFSVKNKEGVGPITGVTVKDITVRDIGEGFAKIKGHEGAEITDLVFENVYMPGSDTPATTLQEMNFIDREHYGNVTIKPIQNEEPRPPVNLALNQPAFSSSIDGDDKVASNAFDGNYNTRFASLRKTDPSWVYVDLGEEKWLNEVHLYWEAAYGKNYRIEVSNDAENWEEVYQTTQGRGGIEVIKFADKKARYVKMLGTERATDYGYSLWEFEVYGPEEEPIIIPVESITVSAKPLSIIKSGKELPLNLSVLPENATDKSISWQFDKEGIVEIDPMGNLIGKKTGLVKVTGQSTNGIKTSFTVRVTK